MGDWADCDSLGHYDRGKASFEGRRFVKDVEVAHEARELTEKGFRGLRKRPKLWALCGNHEDRADRYADDNPEVVGHITTKAFAPKNWEWVPFLKEITLGGVAFSHYFPTGILGKPPGGESPARTMLKSQFRSCVGAHSHLWDYCERTAGSRKIFTLCAGSYCEPSWNPKYAGPSRRLWNDCITILEDVADGYAPTIRRVGIAQIEREFK